MSTPEKIKILYVDDEMNNLVGFNASFRIDYNLFIATNTTEALEHLKKHADIRIIFCDQRMPDKTGVQFFEEIRSEYPLPIRMLLTGYADIDSVIDSINRGNIFKYIKKPWTDADIITSINEANKFYLVSSMLALKNQELEKAYEELDKFSYSVTHDMRGPLLSILGAVAVTQQIDDVVEIKEMLNLMATSVKKLDDFIQAIHDYYSLKRGALQIVEVDFNDLVKEMEDIYKITSNINGVRFKTKVAQHEVFRCDEMSLKVIFNNLLSNAFKYQRKENDDKWIEMDIEIVKGMATIKVTDNGIGIPQNFIGEIFNMFFRATSQDVGSGFGLYNVKDALAKINGEITLNSEIGKGTCFLVTIPNK
jgi:two-component system sensor histidine kinase/response regulator